MSLPLPHLFKYSCSSTVKSKRLAGRGLPLGSLVFYILSSSKNLLVNACKGCGLNLGL